ncbi:MAG: hypothetical protein KDD94_08510 [Calditrichaeota bacterium]|nr:hypothetical protein [Calditrichota bacterium]
MRFSQRVGERPIKIELEKKGISADLKNTLWNNFLLLKDNEIYTNSYDFFSKLWTEFFKWRIDTLRTNAFGELRIDEALEKVSNWFFKTEWYNLLDFIEYLATGDEVFLVLCNNSLKDEMSAYRFVDAVLVEINSSEEIEEIETAMNNSVGYSSVKKHIERALELLADKRKPDYRNSIKESISAVESLARIISDDEKATLGTALKKVEEKHKIPKSLKSAISSLYGYTSDESGIRHSLLEKSINVNQEEARFMLITCSAFVNYLICKIDE